MFLVVSPPTKKMSFDSRDFFFARSSMTIRLDIQQCCSDILNGFVFSPPANKFFSGNSLDLFLRAVHDEFHEFRHDKFPRSLHSAH